ncbi:MAG: XRE family transcriptional regulator [Actinomycetota bacterium]
MNRLRAYRAIEGINQGQLAEILGISTQMVSAVEGGRRTFSGDLTVLGYAPERFVLPEMSPPLHRHKASTSVAAKGRAQELLRLAGEVFLELRDRTERAPRMTLEKLPPPSQIDEIEELAVEVRYLLQHEESGPIRNLTTTIERAGVCLIPMTALRGIDGLSAWVNGVPVIGVSPSIPGDRFRFTLAHEIAHLLLHIRSTENSEHEANRFAGALLMPQSEFELAMPPYPQMRDLIALKSTWGMAISALVSRAYELDRIDDQRYRALQIQMSKCKWRKNEPGAFPPVYGQLLPQLVEANGGTENVARDLGVNRRHLTELTSWSHLRVA